MKVLVEVLEKLKRRFTISIPARLVQDNINIYFRNFSKKVGINGFRTGKVPLHILQKRYNNLIISDVIWKMIESSLKQAFKDKKILPVNIPVIECDTFDFNKDLVYTAIFEVFPDIQCLDLNGKNIRFFISKITDEDVMYMLENLRVQNKNWYEVNRSIVYDGDKVLISFKETFSNYFNFKRSVKNFECIIGSKTMIPGFEDGLINKKIGETFILKIPVSKILSINSLDRENFFIFEITIHKIFEGKLPDLNNTFLRKFNINNKDIKYIKKYIKDVMDNELNQYVDLINREEVFERFALLNQFELPESLVNKEMNFLKNELYLHVFKDKNIINKKVFDNVYDSVFYDQAKKRVHRYLLLSEYIKKSNLKLSESEINNTIDELSKLCRDPNEIKFLYHKKCDYNKKIRSLALEKILAKEISKNANFITEFIKYKDIINIMKNKKQYMFAYDRLFK
ncbi:trigger factor [Candidatus Legionella polyplacis]|uniref:trigger factor n=1 Tax=Candidatus Legionella polyplacis TaxID=2005262 RepID=UPI000C1E2424|nr:trigger factor [Candidatus Legionella polyplacis]ATW01838.1 trigger factor [Candidatus Legionella polyplacis]